MKSLLYHITDDISAIIDFDGDIYNIIYDDTIERDGYRFDFYVRDGMLSIYRDGHPILICGTCRTRTKVMYETLDICF